MYVSLWPTGQIDERDGPLPEENDTQQTEGEAEGLLDSLTEEDSSNEEQEEQGQDNEQSESVDVDSILEALEKRLGDRFDAVADRRVNAILKEVRKQQGEQRKEPPVQTQTDQSVDVRAARLTFKEYLSDEVTFIGSEERKFAMDLGAALIGARAATSDDEEVLGREVAETVAGQVKNLRSYYEARTLDALRRRGALKEKDGQPPKSPGLVGGSSEFAKGAALAQEMYKKTS